MTCRKKKPVGGVSLFGGADIFGDLNKSPHTGSSTLEASMKNKNEVCPLCVCVCRREGGKRRCYTYMYTCM